jgi:L-ornithine N5-oxygenase
VRLELIEHLYEKMYDQLRFLGRDETKWPHRIMGGRRILSVDEKGDGSKGLNIKVCVNEAQFAQVEDGPLLGEETLDVDLVIVATGYKRTAHVDMMRDAWNMLPTQAEGDVFDPQAKDRWLVEAKTEEEGSSPSTKVIEVGRDYAVRFAPGKVAEGSGIWLQGCCEGTHGVSRLLFFFLFFFSSIFLSSPFPLESLSSRVPFLSSPFSFTDGRRLTVSPVERHSPLGTSYEIGRDGWVHLWQR